MNGWHVALALAVVLVLCEGPYVGLMVAVWLNRAKGRGKAR